MQNTKTKRKKQKYTSTNLHEVQVVTMAKIIKLWLFPSSQRWLVQFCPPVKLMILPSWLWFVFLSMFLCGCLFYILTFLSVFLFMLSVLFSRMQYRLYMTLRQGSLNLCLCEILMTVCSWNSCWNCCMSNNDHHHESADGDRWCHVVDGVWLDSWGE